MKAILGRKLEMTQIFAEDGTVTPVTLVQAGPCTILDVRSDEKDHYDAMVLGYETAKSMNKAQTGSFGDLGSFAIIREIRANGQLEVNRGDTLDVSIFELGDKVDVTGQSKGRGFQGVVKRHGFAGSPASHGHKDQLRMPGSIGSTGPQRVFKGTRMAGRMGNDQVTVKNLEIVKIDPKKNIIAIKGAIPGARGGLLKIMARAGSTVWSN